MALLCLSATAGLGLFLHRFTPIQTWMTWKLGVMWFWVLLLSAGCLGLGSAICRRFLRADVEIPPLERTALAIAVGAAAFGTSMYVAGALHLFRPALAVILPLLGIAVGLGRSPAARLARLRDARFSLGPFDLVVIALGALSVGLIYLHVLNPDAPNHDAHWTHVVIAQDYAREGRLVKFRAEWNKNYPHFASLFYTWVFLVPGLSYASRMLLVMHTEFMFLIGTLVGVTAGARWFSNSTENVGRTAWVAFFLFPSIFVYDSNLGGSADHIAALFVVPLFLAIARGSERFSPGLCSLGGALAGAALITKYQSAYVITPLAILVAVRLGWAAWRRWRIGASAALEWRQALVGAGAIAVGAIATSSPYFLENTVFHHNPVYPFMQQLFTASTPSVPDAAYLVSNVCTPGNLRGAGQSLGLRLREAIETTFSFSFLPHYSFLGLRPYFGFLFTLLAPLALLLPRGHRLRVGGLVAGGTLFAWAMTYLVDRNLQIILPLLVTVTAGVIVSVWRMGWIARAGLAPLILLQFAWGGDLMFQGYLGGAIESIRSGMDGNVSVRDSTERRAMTRLVPRGGTVLLHADHVSLGLNREVLSDDIGFQGVIDYASLRTAREVYDRFHALGVTHLAWVELAEPGPHTQRDIVFNALVNPLPFTTHGRYKLAAMPDAPPPAAPPYQVLVLGSGAHPNGIYRIDVLSRCEMRPPERCQPPEPDVSLPGAVSAAVLEGRVDVALIAPTYALEPATMAVLNDRFRLARSSGPYQLYLRR